MCRNVACVVFILSLFFLSGCPEEFNQNGQDGDAEQDVPVVDGDIDNDAEVDMEDEEDSVCIELVNLGLSENELDFGAVTTGTEQEKSFTLTADNSHNILSLTIVDDNETPEFSIITENCTDFVTPSGVCHKTTPNESFSNTAPYTITISYTPSDANLTNDNAILHIETDDACNPIKKVILISRCKGEPNLKLSIDGVEILENSDISFEEVMPDTQADNVILKLENIGDSSANAPVWATLELDDDFTNHFEWTDCNPTELTAGFLIGSGEEKVCTLRFRQKTDPGNYVGKVSLSWNSSCIEEDGLLELDVKAKVADCVIVVEPNPTLDFGEAYYNRDRVNDEFEIENRCPFRMILSGCQHDDSTNFTVDCPAGRQSIAAGAEYTLNAVFHPTIIDIITDQTTISFEREDGTGQQTMLRDMVGRGTPCTYPGCCPPDSDFCQTGQVQCADARNMEKCDELCEWQVLETCPQGTFCTSGGCETCIEGMETCNGAEHWLCEDGVWTTTKTCNDENTCTIDFCTMSSTDADGCIYEKLPNGTPCDDGIDGNGETRCEDGECIEWRECAVDDGICCIDGKISNVGNTCATDDNDCTTDLCDDAGVCVHENGNEGGVCEDDNNACNGVSTCSNGTCTQTTKPVTCSALDECHYVGTCDTTTGVCSNPVGNEGEVCENDHNACNGVSTCVNGTCNQTIEPVTCTALDECHNIGTCDTATGVCSNPNKDDGTTCYTDDQCLSGVCVDCTSVDGCMDLEDDSLECSEPACNTETNTCYHDLDSHDGEECTDDSLTCTQDLCDDQGICTHDQLVEHTCLIAGSCYDENDPGNDPPEGCLICDPQNSTEWTEANGETCTADDNPCTKDVCDSGSCTHPNDDTLTCSDEYDCTVTACNSGSCYVTGTTEGCFIGNACYGESDIQSATGDGSCLICNSSTAWDDWTVLESGESCDDGNPDSENDVCGSGGVCAGNICVHPTVVENCTDGWCAIPEGCFWMGSPDGTCPDGYPGNCQSEKGRSDNETLHQVNLTVPFSIMQHEVTQVEWRTAAQNMGWNGDPSYFGPNGNGTNCGDDCPVERINWYEALEYANYLSLQAGLEPCYILSECTGSIGTGCPQSETWCETSNYLCTISLNDVDKPQDCEGYRLPTEAEWEYSTRSGTNTAIFNGDVNYTTCQIDTNFDQIGWYCGNSGSTSHNIMGKINNGWGIYDTNGNVYEWTWDKYGEYNGNAVDPTGSTENNANVARGGGYSADIWMSRSAHRGTWWPYIRLSSAGFRLVKSCICGENQECGTDGCGNSCGECVSGQTCLAGTCEAFPFPVTPTNQHTCYNNTDETDCSETGGIPAVCGDDPAIDFCGQDSQYHTNSRHFSCSDATGNNYTGCPLPAIEGDLATDSLTGLVWQRVLPDIYDGCTGGTTSGSLCSFTEATTYCDSLEYGGYDDWRLPNIYELRSLLDYGHYSPMIDVVAFPNTSSSVEGFYSSTVPDDGISDRGDAWYVHFDGGSHSGDDYPNKYVRCVRGSIYEPSQDTGRYEEIGTEEPIIKDTETGLIWISSAAASEKSVWEDALNYCESLDYGGYSDWRLPDVMEFSSLVDFTRISPSTTMPFDTYESGANGSFWTSTTNLDIPYSAFRIAFNYGYIDLETHKEGVDGSEIWRAWCVRGGIAECKPYCDGRECGDDGCGNNCGECVGTDTCTGTRQCEDYCVDGYPIEFSGWNFFNQQTEQLEEPQTGVWEETVDGLKIFGTGSRRGATMHSKEPFDFEDSILYFKWKANGGGNFMMVGPKLTSNNYTWAGSAPSLTNMSTSGSYNGSYVVTDDEWYFTRVIFSGMAFTSITATSNYDINGGTVVQTITGTIPGNEMYLCIEHGDVYSSTSAYAVLNEARVCPQCNPSCDGKQCGDDGCGNSCGECGDNEFCTDDWQCESTNLEWIYSEPADIEFTKSEITIGQYSACVQAGECDGINVGSNDDQPYCNENYSDRDNYPINCISGSSMEQFCNWIGGRLPTDTEWGMEATNNGERIWAWGNENPSCNYCIMQSDPSNEATDGCSMISSWPVCSKPNGNSVSGLCDMIGNIRERTISSSGTPTSGRGSTWQERNCDLMRADLIVTLSEIGGGAVDGFRCVREPIVIDGDADGDDDTCGTCSEGEFYLDGSCGIYKWVNIGQQTKDIMFGSCSSTETHEVSCSESVLGYTVSITSNAEDKALDCTYPSECPSGAQGYDATLLNNDVGLQWTGQSMCGADYIESSSVTVFECTFIESNPPVDGDLTDGDVADGDEEVDGDETEGDTVDGDTETMVDGDEETEQIVLKSNVVILEDSVAATVDNPTCGVMQFPLVAGQPPFTVVSGDAIVSGYEGGFLCIVDTVATNGTDLVIITSQGSLEDVIEEGTLAWSVPIEIGDQTKNKGVSASLSLNPITLLDTGSSTITLRPGSLTFQPSFDVEANWGPIAGTYFKAMATGSITADVGIDVEIHETYELNGNASLYDQNFVFYFQAGPLPVAGRVHVEITPGFTATAQADLTSSFGAIAYRDISAGAEYYDDAWHPINYNSQSGYEIYGPDIDGAISFDSEVKLDVNMTLVLYESASAYILTAPRVEGDVSANVQLQYDWDMNACIWAGYGGDITIFHRTLASYDATLFNACLDIWDGSDCFNACSTLNLTCKDSDTVEGCGEADDGDDCLEYVEYDCGQGQVCDGGECVGACECSSGPCCTDGCNYNSSSYVCDESYSSEYRCTSTSCSGDAQENIWVQKCSGSSELCNGETSAGTWTTIENCSSTYKCQYDSSYAWCSYASECDCDCSSGDCCTDGCNYNSSSTVCDYNYDVEYQCSGLGCGENAQRHYQYRYCSGSSSSCTGSTQWQSWQTIESCDSDELCSSSSSSASCSYSSSCVAEEVCNGVDDDGDGIIDELESCWIPVYRFWNDSPYPGWYSFANRCYSNSTTPPSTCNWFRLENSTPEFYLYTGDYWPGGTDIVCQFWKQNSHEDSYDHVLTIKYSEEYYHLLNNTSYEYIGDLGRVAKCGGSKPTGNFYKPSSAGTNTVRETLRYYCSGVEEGYYSHLITAISGDHPSNDCWQLETGELNGCYSWGTRE